MQHHRFAIKACAALATCALLLSGLLSTMPQARAEGAPPETPPSAAATCAGAATVEANIDATGLPNGVLRISILTRGLLASDVVWRRPDGGRVAPLNVRLTSAAGGEAPVTVEVDALRADLTAGDWTLAYELSGPLNAESAGQAPAGGPVLVAPAECLYLPSDRAANVALTPPVGWCALASAPNACQDMTEFRLRTVRFLLVPSVPRIIAEATAGSIRATVVDRGAAAPMVETSDQGGESAGRADPADLTAALSRLISSFSDVVPVADPVQVYVFADERDALADLAGRLLDALWASCGPGGATEGRLFDDALWPLLRAAILTANDFPPDAALARRICEEHRAYCEAAPAGTPPLEAAPLASLCLVARSLEGGAVTVFRAAVDQLQAAPGPGAPTDFAEGWAAAIAGGGSGPAQAAAELLLRFAGRNGAPPARLPDLPDDVLVLGDPDRDNDGLPDRIDPAPDDKGVSLAVAGRTVRLDAPPLISGGRVMVPLRFFAERLGLEVAWDEAGRTAIVSRAGCTALFPIGTHYYLLNGRAHYIDAPTAVVGGRTMVSLRFAAKALGVSVTWDAGTRTVNVWPDQPYSDEAGAPVGGRTAYLTFDDGPEPGMTPRILAVLKEYRAPATFFVVGSAASRHGDLLRRIIGEGHGLGNHTYSHDTNAGSPGFVYRSPASYLAELAACERAIAAATGLSPRATRPPGGSHPHLTEDFRSVLRAHGYLTYDWNASAADSALPRPTIEQVITNIMAGARDGKRSQLIVLMHDGGRDHETTLAALPAVIEYLRACGYVFSVLPGAATAPTQ